MITLKFDLSKQDAELLPPNPILYGRIGDKQSPEVEIHLTQNGSVIDLTGHTLQFEGMTASGARIIDAGGISATAAQLRAGTFRYSFSERGFSSTGPFRLAHFSIVRGTVRRSTNDFSLQVLGTVDMTAPEAESILTEYNELVRKLQEEFDRATQDLTRQVNDLVQDPAWDRLREIQTQLADIESQVAALDFDQIVTDKMKEIDQMVDRRLRDIEEKINDIDPVTLTEVNQELGSLILGKSIVHNQEMTFVGKVPASVVENPHRATFGNSTLNVLPSAGSSARSEEFSQTDYRKLNGSDGEFVTVVGHRSNEAFVSIQWNILEEIRRRYPYWFRGIERENVAILRGMLRKVSLEIECYGTARVRLAHWSGSQWVADPFIASDEQVLTLTKEGPLTTSSAPETGIRIDGTAAFALLGDTIVNNHQIGIGKTTLQVELAVSLPDLYQRLNA